MKEIIICLTMFVGMEIFLSGALGQNRGDANRTTTVPIKPEMSDESTINVKRQYNEIVSRGRDGKFLLYSDRDGSKLFLPMSGGKPGPIVAFDKNGIALPAMNKHLSTHGGGGTGGSRPGCYWCFWAGLGRGSLCVNICN